MADLEADRRKTVHQNASLKIRVQAPTTLQAPHHHFCLLLFLTVSHPEETS